MLSHSYPQVQLEDVDEEIRKLDEESLARLQTELLGEEDVVDETPELIQASTRLVKKCIGEIDDASKTWYLEAMDKCPSYVESLYLPMLRASVFDASQAANRLVEFWNEKHRLFGVDNLFGPITLKDLQDKDLKILRDGGVYLLPKDVHGRAIMAADRQYYNFKENGAEPILRAVWYLTQCAIEDDEIAQRKGIVLLSTSLSTTRTWDRALSKGGAHYFTKCGIVRVAILHFTSRSAWESTWVPVILWFVGPEIRKRFVFHSGKSLDCLRKSFDGYGFTSLPVAAGGKWKNEEWNAWLKDREEKENERMSVKRLKLSEM